jgi:hypothetical protein
MDFTTRPVADSSTPAPETQFQPASGAGAPSPQPNSRWEQVKDFYFANKWYVWAIIAGLLIIGVLAFVAFHVGNKGPGGEANVNISIDAPATAPSGSQVVYKVKVDNQDPTTLTKMELEVVYPDGFTYLSSTPNAQNLSGSVFSIPDLSSGQNAVVIIKVNAQGSVNDEKKLTVRLHYKYSNFNSDFVKEADHTLRLQASDILMELSGPQTATNTQSVSYTLHYKNESDHDVSNARIQLTYPEGFSYGGSDPQPNLGNNIWNVGNLRKNDDNTITFSGTFTSAQPGAKASFKADFQVQDDQGNYNSQASADWVTTISSSPLLVTQEAQGAHDGIVDPGATLTFTIHYQNNAQVPATGVSVSASIDSKAIDLSTLKSEGGAEINNNTITWNTASVSNFEHLNPNESGTLSYNVRLRNPATKDSSKNITVVSNVKIKSNEYSTYLPGNTVNLKVSSPADLSSSVSVVSGPNPPQNGSSTVYQVTLSLRNSNNDMTNAVLTGFIATNISNFDKSSITAKEAGAVSYDPSTGKLTWKVDTLSAHTGDFNPARRLSFQVKVTPSSGQNGNTFTLFKSINFSAKDSFTGQNIHLDTDDVQSSDVN